MNFTRAREGQFVREKNVDKNYHPAARKRTTGAVSISSLPQERQWILRFWERLRPVLSLKTEGAIEKATIALGVAAPTPVRCPEAEKILVGKLPTKELLEEVGEKALFFLQSKIFMESFQGIQRMSDQRTFRESVQRSIQRSRRALL